MVNNRTAGAKYRDEEKEFDVTFAKMLMDINEDSVLVIIGL